MFETISKSIKENGRVQIHFSENDSISAYNAVQIDDNWIKIISSGETELLISLSQVTKIKLY